MKLIIQFTLIALILPTLSCTSTSKKSNKNTPHVSIMTFNVENLFDTVDDPLKDDQTFLPLSVKKKKAHKQGCLKIENKKWQDQCLDWDWNDEVLKTKMERLAKAILQVNDGKGADILVMQEVENLKVLKKLNSEYLQSAGYNEPILIEGSDKRGIDVAFLTRLPLHGSPMLHKIVFTNVTQSQADDTRGILEATFELPGGELLTGYAAHFPAPFHPTAMRVDAYQFLNTLKRQLPKDRLAFAAGDFNTVSAEARSQHLLEKYVRSEWQIAPQISCPECKGTSYYSVKDEWSYLDMILLSKSLDDSSQGWHLNKESIRIANATPDQKKEDGTPAAFEMPGAKGVSDHWPVYLELTK